MKIKHKCKECAELSKKYAKVSKECVEESKKYAEWNKKYADKCQCEIKGESE